MFVKNDDHLSPDSLHTTVYKSHPNINQRISALDDLNNNKHKEAINQIKTHASSLHEPLLDKNNEYDLY